MMKRVISDQWSVVSRQSERGQPVPAGCEETATRRRGATANSPGRPFDGSPFRPRFQLSPQRGFTLMEIAIAVAIIAFALVAIVGLLPLGIETQRDNRELTIINQDGTYLLEAIRGGAANVQDLPKFVDSVNGAPINPATTTGSDIIRALATVNQTNTAIIRSISGAAALRSPAVTDFALRYQAVCQILPANVDRTDPAFGAVLGNNLWELRLALYWPVNGTNLSSTARREVFRTVVTGQVDTNGFLDTSLFRSPLP
jgi:prepilin-type N-terminal cleavage/methylation domain-containing protein